jgi:hypothetical protein
MCRSLPLASEDNMDNSTESVVGSLPLPSVSFPREGLQLVASLSPWDPDGIPTGCQRDAFRSSLLSRAVHALGTAVGENSCKPRFILAAPLESFSGGL